MTASIEKKDNLRLVVSDTGNGINSEDLPKIFDRFHQVDREGEPMQGGTGIGLALAKELARLFKGDITAESELGKGSRFIFTLPIHK